MRTVKLVVIGASGVGKTSLLHRYTQGKFDPKNTTSTTGAFFVTKKVNADGTKVRLQLWDTAGQVSKMVPLSSEPQRVLTWWAGTVSVAHTVIHP